MTQTIEAFVNKLQAEGVEAGRQAAENIRAEAEQQAQKRIEQATQRAEQIVRDAQTEAERIRARTATELHLAARDMLVRLQETLNAALRAVLTPAVRKTLEDPEFLAELIRDVVTCYAQRDAAGESRITVDVSAEMRGRLMSWLQKAFSDRAATPIDLRQTLADAGFEYTVREGTVEVTAEALVETLAEIAGPDLRKLIAEAAGP